MRATGGKGSTMNLRRTIAYSALAAISLAFAFAAAMPARAEDVILKKHSKIWLVFDESISSKTAKPGDRVWFHLEEPVMVDNKTVVPAGEKVYATVEKVKHRGHFGVNGQIRLAMSPLKAVNGKMIPIGFENKGNMAGGKTGEAAGASAAGAVVLGPVGLVGGYFVVGKETVAKPGDKMAVTVDRDEVIRVR